ncbi:MAG: zinc-dependent metalloprotease [Saprospiraceae bacterium]|nr:zinc-dependent metalloprotease [Saprospiraceae bacterium]
MHTKIQLKGNKNLLKQLVFCLLLAGMPALLTAQTTINARQLNFQDVDLDRSFSSYQVFQIDIQKIYELSQTGNRFHFSLKLGEQLEWDLQLDYHDMRSANYREVALTESGPKLLPRRPNITFRGTQGPDYEPVRFTITPDYMLGMIDYNGETYFIEPLKRVIPRAGADYYFVYRATDVLTDPTLECTFNAGKKYALPEKEEDHPHPHEGQAKMACKEVELATAADFLMFSKYGSVAAVNDFIITVTNLMEPLYDDFNLNYLIVDQFVPTSAMADPFTTSDEAFDILDDFSAWAPGNLANHDVGQIWTDRDIQGCGGGPDNFGLIGCAQSIGDVCGDTRYNVCEDFSNSSNCLRVLSAHELGHNWDGVHGEANSNTIMWPTINCSATTWAAGNITRIQDHIDSRACLSDCGTLCNIDVGAVISHENCPGDNDGAISALISGNMAAVTYELTGPVNATNNTGMFDNLPPGDYTLRAIDGVYNKTCFDEVDVTINPGTDNQDPTAVCKNPTLVFNGEEQIALKDTDVWNEAASSDNCEGVFFVSVTPSIISCEDIGSVIPVTVLIEDESGNTDDCVSFVTVEGLPCGWSQQPNGINCVNGNEISYDVPTEVFTATSSDCYFSSPYASDEMAFAQHDLCGDGSLTAQVTSISGNSLGWAGITMRESNAGGAKKVQLLTNLSNLHRREVRYTTNGTAFPQQLPSSNRYWLRLVRNGNQFVGYASANGLQWFQVMAVTVNMNACIEVGLVVTNYEQMSAVTATFANVAVVDFMMLSAPPPSGAVTSGQSLDFEIYPNPASGEVNVNLSPYIGRSVRLELFDIHGKSRNIVELEAVETPTQPIDLSAFPTGMYLIRVQTEGIPDATKRVVLYNSH